MPRSIRALLLELRARLFAAAIPCAVTRPGRENRGQDFLRKDMVFLLERFFYLLEIEDETGLLGTDSIESRSNWRLLKQVEAYFSRTQKGKERTRRIVPMPFFVPSDLTFPIQAADVCVYCVNWGFRLPVRGMNAPTREEISNGFGPLINELQFKGKTKPDGRQYTVYGIVYVSDPYAFKNQPREPV